MNPFSPVLLIEDEPNDVALIMDTLRTLNFANPVHVETDGRKAVDYIFGQGVHARRTGGDPLLVLLDLKLPSVDGREILHQMRTDPHLKNVPVVILTSSRNEDEIQSALQLGANACLVKPLQGPDFLNTISELGFHIAISAKPLAVR